MKPCLISIAAISLLLGNTHLCIAATVFVPDALPNHNAVVQSSSGNAGSALTWQVFKPSVESAASEQRGGVIDFETEDSVLSVTTMQAEFNNGLSTFQAEANQFSIMRRSESSVADHPGPFPSGEFVLGARVGFQQNNNFIFNSFSFSGDGSELFQLVEIGFVLLGDRFSNITQADATAIFSGGGSLTLGSNLPQLDEDDYVFYGFRAPEGESIVSLSTNFGSPQPRRIVFMDDFGFVAVPEPSRFILIALGVIAALSARRRIPTEVGR